jgi:hypothetical protein
MRRRSVLLVVLPALFVLLGPTVYRSYALVPHKDAFLMKIVDPKTGAGVPGVRVQSENGIVCHTQWNGEIAWTEIVLMGRNVRFTVERPDQSSRQKIALSVTRGGHAEISLP